MKGLKLFGLVLFSIVLVGAAFAGGQQDATGSGLEGAPAPFDGSKQVHIALIRQMVEGEFMQM